MRHIQKSAEPQVLVEFKAGGPDWKPSWAALDGNRPVKQEVRASLVKEQGAICCYCEARIAAASSHIEHLIPRDSDPEAKFHLDWMNLVASCISPKEPKEKTYCGQAKGNWHDPTKFVSPLEPNCQSRFRFNLTGDIESTDMNDAAAIETIKRLRLNHKRLVSLRHSAIRAALPDEGEDSADVVRLIKSFSEPNHNGEMTEFVSAIVSTLAQFIPQDS